MNESGLRVDKKHKNSHISGGIISGKIQKSKPHKQKPWVKLSNGLHGWKWWEGRIHQPKVMIIFKIKITHTFYSKISSKKSTPSRGVIHQLETENCRNYEPNYHAEILAGHGKNVKKMVEQFANFGGESTS